jgi:protein SCO1/2
MNNARSLVSVIACLVVLAGCNGKPDGAANNGAAASAPLAGATIGADFTLVDQNGKAVRWADFAGKYRLVYFGYTYCPDVCPVDLQKIVAGLRQFEKTAPDRAARVQPIFITVDPERDTPTVLKPWVAAFHPSLVGLTGTPEQVAKVKRDFAVVSGKEGDAKATKDYLVSHSRTPYLFGPDGKPIALVPVDEPGTPDDEGSPNAVAGFLDQWVK